ncbi:carbamoyl phosphate synthase small subunit [Halobacillus salinarum]|uniref:Carbamoyl phosphate synthase small chain n=1 Tax=Halobacillus salinarum TaxID=2932257 RepID=A0ABY4EL06_9BACI|nr:carbamoyl phosphate synthase small subunit [Halobacillus salinarum]UOQ45145.1 carbamoyl phosphate synthase small subunit [Halobacillus salinarum]
MQGYVSLQDGQQFAGEASKEWEHPIEGEIVFFTGMTGYQEVITDPSYRGQIVVFTYPLIGNYGVNEDDSESVKPQVSGVIMLHCAEFPSHYKSTLSLKEYLNKYNVPYLTGVDTREVTKAIRQNGTSQAVIANQPVDCSDTEMVGQMFQASGDEVETHGSGSPHIALIDFGLKQSILSVLLKKGARVTVVPFTKLKAMKDIHPDGIVLSNGPGNPKDAEHFLKEIKHLIDSSPTLGICLGHQIIALAYGGNTLKLSFGHRGANHPVKDVDTGRVFLTSQNHNYVVDEGSLVLTDLQKRFYNVNDQSVEGLAHKDKPILSAQFHPEANPGPEDAEWLFDDFFSLISVKKGVKAYA